MNITDEDGNWRLTPGQIENRKTGEVRRISEMPSASRLAMMRYDTFLRKCRVAFETGAWPKTHWASGRVTD